MTIRLARADEMDIVRELFLEYAESLSVSLCFQDFDTELASLPGKYAPPKGAIFLAEGSQGVVGVIAVRALSEKMAEMKRLFLRPAARGLGLGRRLALTAIDFARQAGYAGISLDTLPEMKEARSLYQSLGFRDREAYYENPHGAVFLELSLQ